MPGVEYHFTLTGKIKPFVRFTRRGMWVDPEAQEYLASKTSLQVQLHNQMVAQGIAMLPGQTPLRLAIVFYFPAGWHNSDVDNLAKAVADAASKFVYPDDRWLDELYARRQKGPELRAELTIGILEGDQPS